MGVPLVIIHFHGIFHYKPSTLGIPHVWNPPHVDNPQVTLWLLKMVIFHSSVSLPEGISEVNRVFLGPEAMMASQQMGMMSTLGMVFHQRFSGQ